MNRRAKTQPQRLERIFGRSMSIECLGARHFCSCPMLDCACLCHEIDSEEPLDEVSVQGTGSEKAYAQ